MLPQEDILSGQIKHSMDNAAFNTPWVAFCMSTYKRPDLLHNQLKLLQRQTFGNFEVIVSDNDPGQSGKVIVDQLNDKRFKYYFNTQNIGMVKSFNRSIENATAKFIAMLTDDDPVNPNMLQTLYDLSVKYTDYGMYFGSNDRFYATVNAAKLSGAKVGCNSQLAQLDEGTIRVFSAKDFPIAYLSEDFGGGILWSVGIVKREIVLNIGGLPDYGSPNMTDSAYVLLSGSRQGAVFINTSLGTQNIHKDNYSFTNANYDHFSKGISGFYESVKKKLPPEIYNDTLDQSLKNYTARTIIALLIFAKRNMWKSNIQNSSFEKCVKEIFDIRFMRKWKLKYYLAVYFPPLFSLLVSLKNILTNKVSL